MSLALQKPWKIPHKKLVSGILFFIHYRSRSNGRLPSLDLSRHPGTSGVQFYVESEQWPVFECLANTREENPALTRIEPWSIGSSVKRATNTLRWRVSCGSMWLRFVVWRFKKQKLQKRIQDFKSDSEWYSRGVPSTIDRWRFLRGREITKTKKIGFWWYFFAWNKPWS